MFDASIYYWSDVFQNLKNKFNKILRTYIRTCACSSGNFLNWIVMEYFHTLTKHQV